MSYKFDLVGAFLKFILQIKRFLLVTEVKVGFRRYRHNNY